MDLGSGIALGTLIIGAAVPVTGWVITRTPAPTNGDKPMTQALCEAKHKTLDFKINLLLRHFDINPEGNND